MKLTADLPSIVLRLSIFSVPQATIIAGKKMDKYILEIASLAVRTAMVVIAATVIAFLVRR